MKTIRLALTDNKDFRLVNVELPEEPDYDKFNPDDQIYVQVDYDTNQVESILSSDLGIWLRADIIPYKIYSISGWEAKIGYDLIPDDSRWGVTLGDPIATLSKVESEEKEEPKGNMTVEQYEQQLEEKFAYELMESQERNCGGEQYCDCAKGAFERKANRDVVDGYEACCPFRKREPVVEPPVKVSDDIDPYGGLQPTQVKDVFTRAEVREEIRKAFKAGERYGSQVSTKGNIIDYLKENGF